MAHETEAAALLRSGNLFLRRVGLRSSSGELTFVGIKHGAFAIYRGDAPYYHFDLEGRWQRAFVGETHYRKALDGSVDALDRLRDGPGMVLRRRKLSFAETAGLDASIRGTACDLASEIDAGSLERVPPPAGSSTLETDELRDLLARVARWDAAAWFGQREAYFGAYASIGLLPPNSHTSVVLQATLGDASGRPFGGGKPHVHDVRDPERFEEHVRVVTTLLGRRLAQCRAVFLGGADVLRRPTSEILPWFEILHRHFPIAPTAGPIHRSKLREDEVRLAGIDTFLNEFTPPLPDRDGWRELKELGLDRVNLGIESGAPEVRALYGRSWSDNDLRALVADLKAEAIPTSLLVLVGAGGEAHAKAHAEATVNLLDSLPLADNDLVYLVDADAAGDASLGGRVRPLDGAAIEAQRAALKQLLDGLRDRTGARIIPYNPEKQWN